MGAYLSEPITEKISSDESNEKLECGASSMQGWRVNQEDAHNTILDYDINTALFAVYDGHGGAEVAAYCSQKLPDYIKNTEEYKSGEFVKALENAFLGFDATIPTKEVMDILKELAGETNPPGSDNDESEDENVSNLYKEAKLPLQELLAKYDSNLSAMHRNRLAPTTTPLSPCLRAKKNGEEPGCSGASSSGEAGSSSADAASSSGPSASGSKDDDMGGVSSTNSNEDDKDSNQEVSTSDQGQGSTDKANTTSPDSSEDKHSEPEQSASSNSGKPEACNGEVTESKIDGEEGITSSNGSTPSKGSDKSSPVSSSEKTSSQKKRAKFVRAAAEIYQSLLKQAEDDDDSDSNDETFRASESEGEEGANGVEESDDDEGEEEEAGEEDECDESSDDGDDDICLPEEPGNDSGCTAVVALLKGNELYVANAGDSRCIICRDGKAIDMSIDHKPEDPEELDRITKAGGNVSSDGRINGGLNLSRAIGDHSYKQNKEMGAKEQMITALPDVKTLTIDPKTDQFMVLACDGIWNFMTSQDVCDFILPKLVEGRERLSQICEEMFDHCLAPNTTGDGTGCDNMTAIIVRFKDGLITEVAKHTTDVGKKRTAEEPAEEQDSKRQKVDGTLSSSVVTSSV